MIRTTTTLPAVPDEDSERLPAIVLLECRSCGARSDWTPADEDGNARHDWGMDHARATGHRKFSVFMLSRGTSTVWP